VKFLIKAQATNTSKIGNVCNVNSSPPIKQIPVKMATSQLCIKPIIVQYTINQGFAAQTLCGGGPHFFKMLQPRAAHSPYKVGTFIQCVNNHILQTIFIFHTRYV